jgi:hypothetical protein
VNGNAPASRRHPQLQQAEVNIAALYQGTASTVPVFFQLNIVFSPLL